MGSLPCSLKNITFVIASILLYVDCHVSCPWLAKVVILKYSYMPISVVLLLALVVKVVLRLSSWHELGLGYYLGMRRMAVSSLY